jgi:type I restriction-modification system DNA methylase subunit
MKKVIPSEVLDVLKQSQCEGNQLHLPRQLSRDIYVQTAKIIELLGGKWNRSFGAHVFEGDCAERVDEAVMAGEVTDFQKLYQFYETPPELARRMVALADVREGQRVLEPSAGRGGILKAIPQTVHRTAVELNSSMADLGAHAQRVHYGDFLQCNGELGAFDRIIANPPFRNGQDVDHVRHMHDLLKPGGILVTVMSPAWQYRTDRKHAEFRAWLQELDHEVEDLPGGTFKSSGTNIRTLLVTIRK